MIGLSSSCRVLGVPVVKEEREARKEKDWILLQHVDFQSSYCTGRRCPSGVESKGMEWLESEKWTAQSAPGHGCGCVWGCSPSPQLPSRLYLERVCLEWGEHWTSY